MNKSRLLSCENLGAAHSAGYSLFSGLGFSLLSGGLLLIQGGNGSGKSLLLSELAKNHPEALLIGQEDVLPGRRRVRKCVEKWAKREQGGAPELVETALHYFGLLEYQHVRISSLSAGQRQRLRLTRLILIPRKLWLLDSPFEALDDEANACLQSLIQSRIEQGGSAIISSVHVPANSHIQLLALADFR